MKLLTSFLAIYKSRLSQLIFLMCNPSSSQKTCITQGLAIEFYVLLLICISFVYHSRYIFSIFCVHSHFFSFFSRTINTRIVFKTKNINFCLVKIRLRYRREHEKKWYSLLDVKMIRLINYQKCTLNVLSYLNVAIFMINK